MLIFFNECSYSYSIWFTDERIILKPPYFTADRALHLKCFSSKPRTCIRSKRAIVLTVGRRHCFLPLSAVFVFGTCLYRFLSMHVVNRGGFATIFSMWYCCQLFTRKDKKSFAADVSGKGLVWEVLLSLAVVTSLF